MTKSYIFCIANYSDQRQEIFDNFFAPRWKQYCNNYNYQFEILTDLKKYRNHYTWQKITHIKELLDSNFLKDGDRIANVDADMCLMDGRKSIFPSDDKSFSLAIDNGNTFCFGWVSMVINDWSRKLIYDLLDENRWNIFKNDPFWDEFREQCSFYYLAGIPRHSWEPFFNLPNNGFHNFDWNDPYQYSLEELKNNIEIRGPEWNTTLLEEDYAHIPVSLRQYNIVKSKKENTIIRHFAGGQSWNSDYAKQGVLYHANL